MIDIRPRVSDYTVSEGSNSPLTFAGRTFTQAGQTATNILASDESIVIDFSFILEELMSFLNQGWQIPSFMELPQKILKPGVVDEARVAINFLLTYTMFTELN